MSFTEATSSPAILSAPAQGAPGPHPLAPLIDELRASLQGAGPLENACRALLEYLETLLAGQPVAAVALFPQYRAVQVLAGNDKVHPADLWPAGQRLHEPAFEDATPALAAGPQARALLDAGVLALVKTGQPDAAAQLRAVCLGLAAAQPAPDARSFWKIAAGFFEALAQGRLQPDVYAKRTASRVLMQYAAMAKGDDRQPERLTRELVFFCAQAQGADGAAPVLEAVRAAFGLEGHVPVDYERARFGRFDAAPAAALSLAPEGSGEELRAIFLEEARAAARQGLQALDALGSGAAPGGAQTGLRRAFHTLKSSARLDGRDEFGEAGWALEQMLNAALAAQEPLSADGQALAREALQAFAAWTEAIGTGQDQDWSATPFRAAADAMRLEGRRAPVALRPSRRRREEREAPAPEPLGDEIKQIDHLRIPLPLYNAYLNEAEEWSRCLDMALRYPELEPAMGCAHALASRSAIVGFEGLSRLARALAQALMHVQPQGAADAQQLAVFQAAANEIRRLLHQFAAGFLKAPLPAVEAALQQLLATEMPDGDGAGRDADEAHSALHDLYSKAP